ncbi:MAG: M6 family metalloprotease domain-containing protein [Fibrobacter sp.]|nr:M6 family metalloprotease domain-containing protein [Fibrobacter sp.]
MKIRKILSLAVATCAVCAMDAMARPAFHGVIPVEQPDGSIVNVRKVGDENFNYAETEDSILVVKDSTGYWSYANEEGKSEGVRVHNKDKRSEKEKKFLKGRDSKGIKNRHKNWRLLDHKANFTEPQQTRGDKKNSGKALLAASYRPGDATGMEKYVTRPPNGGKLTQGKIRGLVILVQFADVKFKSSDPNKFFTRFMNEEGFSEYSNIGSARDYFVKNSNGAFMPDFDVKGPFTVSKDRYIYGSKYNENNSFGETYGALLALDEAFAQLMQTDIDMSVYDNDGDGYVDFIYMIYAGVGASDSQVEEAIWPHAGVYVDPSSLNNMWGMSYKSVNRNLKMYKYACSNEISGSAYSYVSKNTSAVDGIGAFAHEFSHVLGLMDAYDIYYSEPAIETPGDFDLMDRGTYSCVSNTDGVSSCTPPFLNAFERYSLGWLEPRTLQQTNEEEELKNISTNDAFVLPSSNKNEYYFLDFHQKKDFDIAYPNSGMAVWRIAYDSKAWENNEVNTVSGKQRNMLIAAEKKTVRSGWMETIDYSYYTFPGAGKVTSFNKFVTLSGKDLGVELYDIVETDSSVKFKVKYNGGDLVLVSSSSAPLSSASLPSSSSVAPPPSSATAGPTSSATIPGLTSSSSIVLWPPKDDSKSSSSAVHVWPWGKDNSSASVAEAIEQGSFAQNVYVGLASGRLVVNVARGGMNAVRIFDMQGRPVFTERFGSSALDVNLYEAGLKGAFVVQVLHDGKLLGSRKIVVR